MEYLKLIPGQPVKIRLIEPHLAYVGEATWWWRKEQVFNTIPCGWWCCFQVDWTELIQEEGK